MDLVRRAALVLAAFLPLLSACASKPVHPPGQEIERYVFDVGFAPAPDRDRTLAGTVTATDFATRRAITTPRFEVEWGKEQTVTAADAAGDLRLEVVVKVEAGGHELLYEATVRKGSRLVASRKASVPVRN